MANDRTIARLESRIKERAAYAIEFELKDPRCSFITITKVELARDLASVKIFYSVLGNEAEKNMTARMLAGASGFIQRQVGRVLRTRHTPRLTFFYDDSIEKIDRMDELLNQAFEKDRQINPEAHADWSPDEASSTASQTASPSENPEIQDLPDTGETRECSEEASSEGDRP